MPFTGINDASLPEDIRKLPASTRNNFVSTFNSILEECTADPEECENLAFGIARSSVKKFSLTDIIQRLWKRYVKRKTFLGRYNTDRGFKTLDNGMWVAWYTNSYKDRDREWFHHGAIQKDIENQWFTGDFPELWFYHIPGTKHGQAVWTGLVGKFAIAVGTFDDSSLAERFKEFYSKNEMSLSHGFVYNPDMFVDNVYFDFQTFEISTLPSSVASNIFTSFTVKKGEKSEMKQVSEDQIKTLVKVLSDDPEMAQAIIDAAEEKTRVLDERNFESKETTEEEGEDDTKQEEEEVEEEEEKTAELQLLEAMSKRMETLEAVIAGLVEGTKELQSRSQQSETLTDPKRTALLEDMAKNKDKQQEQRTNDPVAQLLSSFHGGG